MEVQKKESSPKQLLSRRHFVRNSAIAAASLYSLSFLSACGSDASSNGGAAAEEGPDGRWISAACWENCGGRCVNKVLIKDGEIVRQGTDDSHEDSWDWI